MPSLLPPKTELDAIARKYRTDKSTRINFPFVAGYLSKSTLGNGYTNIYHKYFKKLRKKHVLLLEIGVLDGSSLKTWKEYFENGSIYGIDIDPNCTRYIEDRIRISIGDQSDIDFLIKTCQEINQKLDVIIDDGSHFVNDVITSFNTLYPYVKSGGFYVIEDVKCIKKIRHGLIPLNRGMKLKHATNRNAATKFDAFVEALSSNNQIASIDKYPGLYFIQKK